MHDQLIEKNFEVRLSCKKVLVRNQSKTHDIHIYKGLVSCLVKKAVYFEIMFFPVFTLSFYNNFCDAAELSKVPIKTHAFQFIFLQFLQLSTMTAH